MSESILTATVSNIHCNRGALLHTVDEQVCPHCGAHVPTDPRDWQFTKTRNRPYRCWCCGDDMHNFTPEISLESLTEQERAIYELIEDKGPITSDEIADHFGYKSSDYVRKLLKNDGNLKLVGVINKPGHGYVIS